MNPVKKDSIKSSSGYITEDINENIKRKTPGIFDLSILGKIDLVEAEKIAGEEVMFLTESDLIEGLEDFELVPIKNFKNVSSFRGNEKEIQSDIRIKDEKLSSINNVSGEIEPAIEDIQQEIQDTVFDIEDLPSEITESESTAEDSDIDVIITPDFIEESGDIEENMLISDENLIEKMADLENISDSGEELFITKKLFTVKINEETLDSQLSSILDIENPYKADDKIIEKYNNIVLNSKCKFIDDQFLKKSELDNDSSYNEDPLTERLVKMIEVADGKLELLEVIAKDGDYSNYILEDYTLYNSEKFDNVFKEEVFYIDSDFEFIDNAIIRDDFTKYIHEIDDYFGSEESLIQSEISEILGLIPDENEFIEDKLFGDYYKRYDLDNEIDFIKPEIDFFRSNYTGIKSLNYFTENETHITDTEKWSIEEDISSPVAIVFEEAITEIEYILKKDYDFNPDEIADIQSTDQVSILEEIPDITDKVIILEDKIKLMELTAEFPEQNENLIKLLSYLDGLFEKLPEEVIRKFAESEYFELYSKVLREMGV